MWIIALALGAICSLLLLLVVPVDIHIHINKEAAFHSLVRVRWLFGLITKEIKNQKKPRRAKSEARKKKKKAKKKRGKNIRLIFALLRTRGLIPALTRFLWNILRQIHIRELKIELRLGMGDPGETGMLFGLMGPLLLNTRTLLPLDIQIKPDFLNASLHGNCQATIRLIPIQFIMAFVILLASPTTVRVIKTLLVTRK